MLPQTAAITAAADPRPPTAPTTFTALVPAPQRGDRPWPGLGAAARLWSVPALHRPSVPAGSWQPHRCQLLASTGAFDKPSNKGIHAVMALEIANLCALHTYILGGEVLHIEALLHSSKSQQTND